MILGVIPARYASTRLPGKPLADIKGLPMICRTYNQTKQAKLLDDLIVAVDDQRVFDAVVANGGKALMTPSELATGSDRTSYVAEQFPEAEIIANIQGDQPFISPTTIDETIDLLLDTNCDVATPVKLTDPVQAQKVSISKAVFDVNYNALYFSRQPIPHNASAYYKHIGLYVFDRKALLKFTSLKPSKLELAEKLEQLRMLEYGLSVKVVITDGDSLSVDTPKDLEKARRLTYQ